MFFPIAFHISLFLLIEIAKKKQNEFLWWIFSVFEDFAGKISHWKVIKGFGGIRDEKGCESTACSVALQFFIRRRLWPFGPWKFRNCLRRCCVTIYNFQNYDFSTCSRGSISIISLIATLNMLEHRLALIPTVHRHQERIMQIVLHILG